MLFAVRRSFCYAFLACGVLASAVLGRGIPFRGVPAHGRQSQPQNPPQQAAPPQQTPEQAPSQQAAPAEGTPPPAAALPGQAPAQTAPVHIGPVVVIDAGHGGTDSGARGTSGAVEKDVVLTVARVLRAELERLGYRVVMTRNDDSDPSYDDRAAIANAYRDPVFVSLHVSSTGEIGTARAYYYQFSASLPAPAAAGAAITWEEAQRPFAEPSRRLANLVQIELTHRFSASPNAPTPVAVRSLRSVAAPAIAVEISSVSVADPVALTSLVAPFAGAVAKGVAAFKPVINNPSATTGQP